MTNVDAWHMKKRIIYPHVPLFQVKNVSQEEIVVHVPSQKRVDFYDVELSGLRKSLIFSAEMQAIQPVEVADGSYLMAGLKNGIIEGRKMDSSQQKQHFRLSIKEEISNNAYINDILGIGDGRFVNCYNSGSIAIWNLNRGLCQQQAEAYIKSVHENYVYKLRQYTKGKIVSCGHDKRANLIDLTSNSIIGSLYHSQSVWCCYPINQNTLVSAGLLGFLTFWDVRMSRKIQAVKLLQDQTSFITRLSQNQIVFGQKRWLSYCDFRKMAQSSLSNSMMRQSAQNILVLPEGGVVVGRGGDICLFKSNEQPESIQEQIVKDVSQQVSQQQMFALLHQRYNLAFRIQANLQRDRENDQQWEEEGLFNELEAQQEEQQEEEEDSEQDEDIY